MNLRSVDLNLLVVLDALLDEAHVSRAADRIGLSQPAASSALERCRQLFGDVLLERGRGTMRLTSKAEGLRIPLKNLLAEINVVIDPPQIALADLRQTVRIVTADYPAMVVMCPLHERLRQIAPGIDLVFQPWHGATTALDGLAKGAVDLAVSVFPSVEASFRRIHLIDEVYRVVMRKGHPAAKRFNLDRWLTYPHILVSGRGATEGPLDQALQRLGKARRVGVVIPSFVMVPPLLEGSDLIAMLPSRCVPKAAGSKFAVRKPPIDIDGFPLHLAWHARRDQDTGVQYVAKIIKGLFTPLSEGRPGAHR